MVKVSCISTWNKQYVTFVLTCTWGKSLVRWALMSTRSRTKIAARDKTVAALLQILASCTYLQEFMNIVNKCCFRNLQFQDLAFAKKYRSTYLKANNLRDCLNQYPITLDIAPMVLFFIIISIIVLFFQYYPVIPSLLQVGVDIFLSCNWLLVFSCDSICE